MSKMYVNFHHVKCTKGTKGILGLTSPLPLIIERQRLRQLGPLELHPLQCVEGAQSALVASQVSELQPAQAVPHLGER